MFWIGCGVGAVVAVVVALLFAAVFLIKHSHEDWEDYMQEEQDRFIRKVTNGTTPS